MEMEDDDTLEMGKDNTVKEGREDTYTVEMEDNDTLEREDTWERMPTEWRSTGRIPTPCGDRCHHHIPNTTEDTHFTEKK